MTIDDSLVRLGDALESAVCTDLAASAPPRRRRIAPRFIAIAAVLAVAIPGLAFGARALIGTEEVAASMPAGTLALAGTEPTCTVVEEGVEYHCTLSRPPAPEVSDWLGTVEPTVDVNQLVNGGCRSLRSDGLEWQCYLGQVAVDQQIIGQGFLGEKVSGPGVG